MASATYDGVKRVRAAIGAERRRTAPRLADRRDERPGAEQRGSTSRAVEILRGVGASVLIAVGYVALVTGLRWLLTLA